MKFFSFLFKKIKHFKSSEKKYCLHPVTCDFTKLREETTQNATNSILHWCNFHFRSLKEEITLAFNVVQRWSWCQKHKLINIRREL